MKQAKDPEGHQFYKVTVDNWYIFGNFEDHGAQKYSLPWKRVKQ